MSIEVESEVPCKEAIVGYDILARWSDRFGPVQHAEVGIIQESESARKKKK